jgi:predicted DNA-binding transcriptional regulator YafY
MAQGRPTSALEIKREVEGYSDMNDDAFARRFYADRAELDALGITLQVEKPGESLQGYESELYSLPPENYYLPEIRFGDDELAALQTALQLLDGEFAYAEPLRLALQQVSWGRPSPLTAPEQSSVEVRMTAKADGAEVSQRLSKIETAISRRKTIEFTYYDRTGLEGSGRWTPTTWSTRRAVLPDRTLARTRCGARLSPLADPRQGLLRVQAEHDSAAGEVPSAPLRPPRRVATG